MLKKTIKAIAPILNVSQSGWKGVRIWALICIIGFFFLYLRLGYFRTAASSASGVDPVYYFIYLPSVVFDHDLDFTNQLIRMHGVPDRFIPLKPGALPATLWAPGSALLWLPFYLAGHAFALVLNSPQFPADGYSGIYQGFVYAGNTILALLGIFFLIEFLKLYLNPLAALAGTLSVLACSFFAFYMMPPYLDSSAASFASASLFLFLAAQKKRAFWTGAVAGLMVVVRNQSAILLLVYAIISLREFHNVRKSRSLTLDWFFGNFKFLISFLAILSFQIFVWRTINGTYGPFTPDGYLNFLDPHLTDVFFSMNHGLFSWHPLLLPGIVGLFFRLKQFPILIISLLLAFFTAVYVNSIVWDWWAGWSFGARRFSDMLPVFGLGIGFLFSALSSRLQKGLFVLIFFFALFNQLFIFQWRTGLISPDQPISVEEYFVGKLKIRSAAAARRLLYEGLFDLSTGKRASYEEKMRKAYETYPRARQLGVCYVHVCASHRFEYPDCRELTFQRRGHSEAAAQAAVLSLLIDGRNNEAVTLAGEMKSQRILSLATAGRISELQALVETRSLEEIRLEFGLAQ